VCTTASKLIILGRVYTFKISGIEKGGWSEPSEPPLPTPLNRSEKKELPERKIGGKEAKSAHP